jgi:hypothetical protein
VISVDAHRKPHPTISEAQRKQHITGSSISRIKIEERLTSAANFAQSVRTSFGNALNISTSLSVDIAASLPFPT